MISDDQADNSERSDALFQTLLRLAAAAPRQKIPGKEHHNPAPLSSVQEGLWLAYQLNPADTAYNVAKGFLLQGSLDRKALERSINEIVNRHEILRTRFVIQDGRPVQSIQPASAATIPLTDLYASAGEELSMDDAVVRSFILHESQIPFDLSSGPLLRLNLLRLAHETHLLLLVIHHIVVDVWSLQLFKRELAAWYERYAAEHDAPSLPDLPIQYADFAFWQREWLGEETHEKELSYWSKTLQGLPATSTLPPDFPRPAIQVSTGGREFVDIPDTLADALRKLSRKEGATLFMTLLSALYALIYRYSGQTDITIGSPSANRYQTETRELIGCFLNTLVLRCDLAGNPTFRAFLGRVRQVALAAYANQALPFEHLLEVLQPERSLSHAPLFQVMFNHLDFIRPVAPVAGLEITEISVEKGSTLFDIYLETEDNGHTLSCTISYDRDLYDVSTIRRFVSHFTVLLHEIAADPDQEIDKIPILTPDEYEHLEAWNRTGADYTEWPDVVTLFYDRALRHRDDTAYIYQDRRITFGELNRRSNQLAHYLIAKGVRPGMRIGLALERSLDVPVALLAIFKTGAVYVPLDPTYPRVRLQYIARDTGLGIILTSSKWQNLFAADEAGGQERQIFVLDDLSTSLSRFSDSNVPLKTNLDESFFIIYTSGSSGQPRGVEHLQRGIINRLAWMWQTYPIWPEEVGCQKTSLNFVDSMWELLGYLLQGAPTVIIPDDTLRDPRLVVDMLARERVTRLWLVPSLLREILYSQPDLQQRLPRLTFWVCSGEALPADLAREFRQLMPAAKLHNPYGTSEVWCVTWYDPDEGALEVNGATVPIGRPIGNTRTYVVDSAQSLVPIGVVGELWVSGAGLAHSYVDLPDLTAERFISNPFIETEGDSYGNDEVYSRIYRTGDFVRRLADGSLEYLGRADRQINLRGIRIELGEIEALLRRHDAVADATVVTHSEGQRQQLIAYVSAFEASETLPGVLREYLQAWLPDYMVPWRIIPIANLPLTPSGKIDRRTLSSRQPGSLHSGRAAAAPETAYEKVLAEIWQEVLNLETVDINDSFFDAGGNSLSGMRLFALIEQRLGKQLPLSRLFQTPTIAQLANEIEKIEQGDDDAVLSPVQTEGERPPFFAAHGILGDGLAFTNVVPHLELDQPFYGFKAFGLRADRLPDHSIEEMAARYVKETRQVQPHGPYYLGGYCFGGVIAYEMACQLEAQGERTALVAIIEGSAPRHLHQSMPFFSPLRLQTVRQALPTWVRGNKEYGGWQLGAKLRNRLALNGVWPTEPPAAESIAEDLDNLADFDAWRPNSQRQLLDFHLTVLRKYVPKQFAGRITLIRARSVRISHALSSTFDPLGGWGQLAAGGVELRFVTGTHKSILQEPNAAELADELQSALKAAAGSDSRGSS